MKQRKVRPPTFVDKAISLVAALALVIGFMPAFAPSAYANEATETQGPYLNAASSDGGVEQNQEENIAQVGDVAYSDLSSALSAAQNNTNENKIVRLLKDYELTSSLTIPQGVTLLVPCRENDIGYEPETDYNPDGLNVKDVCKQYRELIVDENVTITVKGTLLVNAYTCGGSIKDSLVPNTVNGNYGMMELNGTIEVKSGGVLDVCGYVEGNGSVIAEPGSIVRDVYCVDHWRGGSQAYEMFPTVYPMNEVHMNNIQVPTIINAGAELVGTVKMTAWGAYYRTRFCQVSGEGGNGLIRMANGTLKKTYDSEGASNDNDYVGSGPFYRGKESFVIEGDGTVESGTLTLPYIGEQSTADFLYPVDGDLTFDVTGNWVVKERLKFMPGAQVILRSGSMISVDATLAHYPNKANQLVFYTDEGFDDVSIKTFKGETKYPDGRGDAVLTLEGNTTAFFNADFAGTIKIDKKDATRKSPARVVFGKGVTVTTSEANGYCNGTKSCTFNTMIKGENETIKIESDDGGQISEDHKTFYPVAGTPYACYYEGDKLHILEEKVPEFTPDASVDFEKETLTGLTTETDYKVDGEVFHADANGEIPIDPSWFGKKLALVKAGNNTTTADSKAQTLKIDERPAAPSGLSTADTTSYGATDGKIEGFDSSKAYEYKAEGTDSWNEVPQGKTLEGLSAGNYEVRLKATEKNFASEPAVLTVSEPSRPTPPSSDAPVPPPTGGSGTGFVGSAQGSTGQSQGSTENPDGSVTTTTTNPDGSKTESTTYADGTITEKNTSADGVVSEKTVTPDNTITEKVTQPDGAVTEKTTTPEGISGQVEKNAEGNVTSANVNIPKDLEKQEIVTAPVTIPAEKDAAKAPEVHVQVGFGETAKVELPVTEFGPGTVAILVYEDGTEEVVRDCTIGENGVILNVEGDVTLKIVERSQNFTDVASGNWASDAVEFVAARELFQGTGNQQFTPEGNMTRGMLVTVLYRLAYEPEAAQVDFDDMNQQAYYSDAVAWAASNGVVTGYSDHAFGPDDDITREQLATILYRYAKNHTATTGQTATLTTFADASQISPYAAEAMSWAVSSGLINGVGNNQLAPEGDATRAQVATMLMRFCENITA